MPCLDYLLGKLVKCKCKMSKQAHPPPKPGAFLLELDAYFLASAFMSQNQEVRVLMRPPIWSALPLFGSGTKTKIRVPAVMPKTGDT